MTDRKMKKPRLEENINKTIMKNPVENDCMESVLAEQRRQIIEAKALDSDLDFAFNLQMQEAINASLLLNPSPSLSPPQNVTVADDDFDYAGLLLEDIERLEQERGDREVSQILMREMREDLNRRIHDQNFAADILNIPDPEWERYGYDYQREYATDKGSSSSSFSSSRGAFRVYCKGVESEERIRDRKVIVGGIGVAICDSRDNLIFEVSKPLQSDISEEGKGKEISNAGVAELEALIEGLDAAFSLELKSVTLFCDDFMVYQYVTGRVQPKQSKISTLVNQVSLLQKKFTDCKPSLVASSDIKFAFKFARDAIVSQITWRAETSEGEKKLKETCVICYEDTDFGQMFSVDGCLHRYCFSCMKQHVEVKLLNGMEAKCPHEGCNSEVAIDSCGKFLDPKLVNIMSQRKKEASIAVTEKVYCPYPRCSALMSKSEALEYTKLSYVGAEKSGARKCVKCHFFFCINCRVPWHHNMTCYDYRRSNPNRMKDQLLDNLAKKRLWRQCVKCSHMVELAEGCNHITCRCGYEFCYTCGAEWKGKKQTCKCPIWDERNIIRP